MGRHDQEHISPGLCTPDVTDSILASAFFSSLPLQTVIAEGPRAGRHSSCVDEVSEAGMGAW